jgi:hypothetical protein
VRAKQGGCAPSRRGRESDSSLSPARPRVRDDRRGPLVIGCGAVRAGEAGRQRLLGQLGLLDREAAGARAGLRGCWAGGAGLPGRRGWVGLEGEKGLSNKEKGFSIFGKGVSNNRIQI